MTPITLCSSMEFRIMRFLWRTRITICIRSSSKANHSCLKSCVTQTSSMLNSTSLIDCKLYRSSAMRTLKRSWPYGWWTVSHSRRRYTTKILSIVLMVVSQSSTIFTCFLRLAVQICIRWLAFANRSSQRRGSKKAILPQLRIQLHLTTTWCVLMWITWTCSLNKSWCGWRCAWFTSLRLSKMLKLPIATSNPPI